MIRDIWRRSANWMFEPSIEDLMVTITFIRVGPSMMNVQVGRRSVQILFFNIVFNVFDIMRRLDKKWYTIE